MVEGDSFVCQVIHGMHNLTRPKLHFVVEMGTKLQEAVILVLRALRIRSILASQGQREM